jgi:uncharacterized protein
MKVNFDQLTLILLPEKAVYLEQTKTLLIADLHLGKEHALMDAGSALPGMHSANDQKKIIDLIKAYNCTELVILGDFIHSPKSAKAHKSDLLETFSSSIKKTGCQAYLVPGNHDRLSQSFWQDLGVNTIREGSIVHGLSLFHEPPPEGTREPWLAGHIHPAIYLQGPARDRLRIPCFWQQGKSLVLPAFGSLTGGFVVKPSATDRIYISNGTQVVHLK